MKKIILSMLLILGIVTTAMADDSLEKVNKKGYFVVGLDATFAPMGFRGEDGKLVGMDIDLAREVASRMGVEARFKPCEWDGIIFDLRSNNIDMVWNGMTITPNRARQVLFSEPYLANDQIVFTRADEGEYKIEDLAGKVVGVQLGSSGAEAVRKSSVANKIKDTKKYSTNVEALMDLEAGRLDAVVMDSVSGKYYNKQKNTLNASKANLTKESFGIAFRKNDKTLAQKINDTLEEMKKDGTFDKIKSKWIDK